MNDAVTIEDELSRWNGAVESLRVLYQQYRGDEQLIEQLLSLLDSVTLQLPLTWLLKHALEDGVILEHSQIVRLLQVAPSMDNWQARMHLLQSLQYLAIPAVVAEALRDFLEACLQEDNKFIRAWAYQGFSILAGQHDDYREQADSVLQKAMREEAPAVKARLRHRLKQVTVDQS